MENNLLLISSHLATTEEVVQSETTTAIPADLVETIQQIVEDFTNTSETTVQNDTNREDRTIVVVVTTNIFIDENNSNKNKQMHNDLSFGNPDFFVNEQKSMPQQKSLDMHNNITAEFFNNNLTENNIIAIQNVPDGRSFSFMETQEKNNGKTIELGVNTKSNDFQEQHQNSNLHELEPLSKILDSEVREEFTKDIPSNQHVPLDVEISEDLREYAPLKDISEYVVEEVQSSDDRDINDYLLINRKIVNELPKIEISTTPSVDNKTVKEEPSTITKVTNILVDPDNVIPAKCKITIGIFEYGTFDCFNDTESQGNLYLFYQFFFLLIPILFFKYK